MSMAEDIKATIDSIIRKREKNLPVVRAKRGELQEREKRVEAVLSGIEQLMRFEKKIDEGCVARIKEIRADLHAILSDYSSAYEKLSNLESRFSRKTINIGVSGEARVGKSTTLQSFSGLTDEQIPTGSGLPVTAVRSEIFNQDESYALVEFRDTEEFINEYIRPHTECVNGSGGGQLSINSLAKLKNVVLPSVLGENVDSRASKSLRMLKDAQESLPTYSPLLTGETKRVSVDEIRQYVAYPTDDELSMGDMVNRAYLAVKSVKVFSHFPALQGEPIGLVDLPGLGEIGKSVADIYTAGLENEVDQILLIMRPTAAEGYLKVGIADNIDQLRTIQKGIVHRGDLITAAINNDESNTESARTLRNDFESVINSAQASDCIEVKDYDATDMRSVQRLFGYIIEKLVRSLPSMDQDVFNYAMRDSIELVDRECDGLLNELLSLTSKIMRTIPLEDAYLDKLADSLSRTLIYEYDELEEEKYSNVSGSNPLRADLEKQVESIYSENEKRINNGLFLRDDGVWRSYAKGRSDYVNFLRSDAKRVKAEIADSYRGVDVFYESAIDGLKAQVLSVFYSRTGSFYRLVGVDPENATSDEDIRRLADELDAATRDEGFAQCFRFIIGVTFKFSQNVFYNIFTSLGELQNPKGDRRLGEHGLSGSERIAITEKELKRMASAGNLETKNRILEYNDEFNRFLFTCMTFFNDFLYRKDDRRFERNIRLLLKERRNYIISEQEEKIDRDLQGSIERLRGVVANASTRDGARRTNGADSRMARNPIGQESGTKADGEIFFPVAKQESEDAGRSRIPSADETVDRSKPKGLSERDNRTHQRKAGGYKGNFMQEW